MTVIQVGELVNSCATQPTVNVHCNEHNLGLAGAVCHTVRSATRVACGPYTRR